MRVLTEWFNTINESQLDRVIEEAKRGSYVRDRPASFFHNWGLDALRMYDESRDWLKRLSQGRILVVGSGEGKEAMEFKEEFPQLQIDSIDLLPTHDIPGITQYKRDVQSLDFTSESFDFVFSQWTMDYVVDKVRALREINRILTPGGHALLKAPSDYFSPKGTVITIGEPNVRWTMNSSVIRFSKSPKTFLDHWEWTSIASERLGSKVNHRVVSVYRERLIN